MDWEFCRAWPSTNRHRKGQDQELGSLKVVVFQHKHVRWLARPAQLGNLTGFLLLTRRL